MAAAATMMPYPVRNGFETYPPPYPTYQTRAPLPQLETTQATLISSSSHHAPLQQSLPPPPHHYQSTSRASPPREANSPRREEAFKPLLPSISNLLDIAARQTAVDSAPQRHALSSQTRQELPLPSPRPSQAAEHDARLRASATAASPRSVLPLPLAMRNASSLGSTDSPSTVSSGSNASSAPYIFGSTINNMDPSEQQRSSQAQPLKRQSSLPLPNMSPYKHARYSTSPYVTSPVPAPIYYPATEPTYPVGAGLYHQRPLPSNFPPSAPAPVQSTHGVPTPNLWEHHHYISPSSQATYPQSQDRYICPTCNKAFSRPSSLKIHSHSHSGEKPFRCPHAGCGKAFSVRSNMKRHERGCHSGMLTGSLPHPAHTHLPPMVS